MYSTIAQRLEAFINSKNLSQREFSKIVGYPESSLSGFLNGKTSSPRLELVEGLVDHFPELDLVWLISGKGSMIKSQGASDDPKEDTGPMTRKEMIDLLKKRVNELEREIARRAPELAKDLGIDEKL